MTFRSGHNRRFSRLETADGMDAGLVVALSACNGAPAAQLALRQESELGMRQVQGKEKLNQAILGKVCTIQAESMRQLKALLDADHHKAAMRSAHTLKGMPGQPSRMLEAEVTL